jgi:NADH dehydrogenase FAD-containing subunit
MNVVLAGAGHAHLYLAKRARAFAARGIELILVDPDAFDYSGLATGVLGGDYEWPLDRVDARRLIERNGGRFVRDCVVGLDAEARRARLESGGTLDYGAISFNVGSTVEMIPGAERAWTVKPIANLWRLHAYLRECLGEGGTRKAVVIGGGATGVEVAANMDALARRQAGTLEITLISAESRLLTCASQRASQLVARYLRNRGIHLVLEQDVQCIRDGAACMRLGERHEFDILVLASGLKANPLVTHLGLAADEKGGLCVDACLRSLSADNVFGVGDCILFDNRKLPMLGVHGVRQAPILMHNLLARVTGGNFRQYRPRKHHLSILNLGCGEALALWGPFHWLGRASFWWKDHIDRKFLAQYR